MVYLITLLTALITSLRIALRKVEIWRKASEGAWMDGHISK